MTSATPTRALTVLGAIVAVSSSCTPPDVGREGGLPGAYLWIAAAEDARPDSGQDLATLIRAASGDRAFLRQAALRALGRLENPELIEEIEPALADPVASVRAEATNALAQAVHRVDGDLITDLLLERARVERDSVVLGVVARSLGRSAESPATRTRASDALTRMSRTAEGGDAPLPTLVGVALGFESLVRRAQGRGLGRDAAARLTELVDYGAAMRQGGDAARVRALAVSTLGQARRLDAALIERARRDADPGVRLAAARHVDVLSPGQRPELIRRLLSDSESAVAIETLRQIAREPVSPLFCRYLLAGAAPAATTSVRVMAIDGLARPCPQLEAQREALYGVATELDGGAPEQWHAPAHALLALARVSPDEARELLPRFVAHTNPFARDYAARAAARLGDRATLRTLASDEVANVRTAALSGLFTLEGHAIDELLVGQLTDDDPQLLMTVARLLEGSPGGIEAARALLGAFQRISGASRETWRDPRRALLSRVAELGDASMADRLGPYLSDYDPVVAADVAGMMTDWTGRPHSASPAPLPRAPLPAPAELTGMQGASILLHMRSGGVIEIELMPYLATTNTFRFVRLVEAGYFDGLTFHRWSPNFVIQGGSPGANEFQGDGPYTRDEVGLLPHWRGTVGISTRGRDTGDGQIFINLVDNPRLNHEYTIVGRVVDGLDVVDAVLEGAVIEWAEVRRRESS